MYCPVSRAAVHKRTKEGKLSVFLYHVKYSKRSLFGKIKTVRQSPYAYIPVSEAIAWRKELEERAIRNEEITREELQGAKPDWTVISDCTTFAQAYSGARLSLAPGEIAFALRELHYRFENGQLKSGANNAVLLDNVAAFDVSFGVADSSSAQSVLRYEDSPADVAGIRSVRIALVLRDPGGRVKDQGYNVLVALRNRLA